MDKAIADRIQEAQDRICKACGGTGDTGRNPSYGPCQNCAGTGKIKLPGDEFRLPTPEPVAPTPRALKGQPK